MARIKWGQGEVFIYSLLQSTQHPMSKELREIVMAKIRTGKNPTTRRRKRKRNDPSTFVWLRLRLHGLVASVAIAVVHVVVSVAHAFVLLAGAERQRNHLQNFPLQVPWLTLYQVGLYQNTLMRRRRRQQRR